MSPQQNTHLRLILAIAIFACPALGSTTILLLRARSVVAPAGRVQETSGGESISIYNILKIGRGFRLYQDPRNPPFYPSTLYNAGFYRFYSGIARLFTGSTDHTIIALRFTTLALACLGLAAIAAYSLRRSTRNLPRAVAPIAAATTILAAIATSLGGTTGWWLLTVRPDIGASAFGAIALAAALTLGRDRPVAAGLVAGILLAAAWSFKQSTIFLFLGLSIEALFHKRKNFLIALILPVASTIALFAALLGPVYRYNAFFASSLSSFHIANLVKLAVKIPLKGALPLAAAICSFPLLKNERFFRTDEASVLKTCWWITLIGGAATCCRDGSEANYFFEFWTVVGFLAVAQARIQIEFALDKISHPRPATSTVVLAAIALGSVGLEIARPALPNRFGTVYLKLDDSRRTELERARELARRRNGAIYCRPALWGLAWDLPFPAYVFDDYPYFQRPAERRGLLNGGGLESLILNRHFQLMILENDDEDTLQTALKAGYRDAPGWSRIKVLLPPESPRSDLANRDRPWN